MTDQKLIDFCKNHTEMTVKEIAKATHNTNAKIYGICRRYGAKIKTRAYISGEAKQKKDISRVQCKNRPLSCFNCTNEDCICSDKCTPLETAYAFIGTGDSEGVKIKALEDIT